MNALLALVLCFQVYLVLSDDCSPDPCPSGMTCCPTSTRGVVGCCPKPNAVCCADKVHCCPENTVCNLSSGTCDEKTTELIPLPFLKPKDTDVTTMTSVVIKDTRRVDVVYCPDGLSYCPDNNTCCKQATGQYGCCPYPSAMCCSDLRHCCPYGTRCDFSSSQCLSSTWNVAPKRPRTPALPLPILL